MKLPKLGLTKEVKQSMMGGALGGTIVGVESGLSWFSTAYPAELKAKLVPQLPRNGALIASLAPAGAAYYIKKKGSAKRENLANGILFFNLPSLVDQIIYNVAYEMGRPVGGLRFAPNNGMRLNIRSRMAGGVNTTGFNKTGAGLGKYTLKTSSSKTAMSGGIGKYR